MIFKDYYKILGLQNNKVTMAEIKTAYREQAKKYHPDVNIANKKYEERFKDINEAYRVLSDSISKRKYDRMWNRNVGRKNASYEESKRSKDSLFSDFFTMFLGEKKEEAKISDELKQTIQDDLKNTAMANSVQLQLYTNKNCNFFGDCVDTIEDYLENKNDYKNKTSFESWSCFLSFVIL